MSEPIKLPPIPREWDHNGLHTWERLFTASVTQQYARLAVEQNTAALRAERDALRSELATLRAENYNTQSLLAGAEAECDALRARAEAAENFSDVLINGWRGRAEKAEAERDALRAEVEELDQLRNRMSELLTATAEALRGPPAPQSLHDWSSIPDRTAAVVNALCGAMELAIEQCAERDALRGALHQISLCSQNSMSTIRECGRIARTALNKEASDE